MVNHVSELTDIQRRCLRLVAANRTSKEIAIEVGLSPMTVDQYVSRAVSALGAQNRRDAARIFSTAEASPAFNELEFKTGAVAPADFSSELEAASAVADEPKARRFQLMAILAGWVERHILDHLGGARHDLSKSGTLFSILSTALITTGVLAAILTVGYWLNYLFA